MSARTRRLRVAVLLVAMALMTGCVRMPSDGPVVRSQVDPDANATPGISYDPLPPQDGQSPTEIVSGFLEAMKATPIRTNVARQFLTVAAQADWAPEHQILTYAELGTPTGQTAVSTVLTDVNVYDERGAWVRTDEADRLDLTLTTEDGEWRIADAPDALVVPGSWFDDWYQRVSLFYFDPTAQILVPEPVFVPEGEQFASSLVRGLLTPPAARDDGVVRTFFPPGTTPGLSVPISAGGVAKVSLAGDPDAVNDETAKRMLVQLVWTLQQEPRIHAVELKVGDRTFRDSGSGPTPLDYGAEYDATDAASTGDLFGLQDGLLVSGPLGSLGETLGPLGQADVGATDISVNLSGTTVAAVTGAGSVLIEAPLDEPGAVPQEVVSGAADLLTPAWDHLDRMWVVDRAAGRARVYRVADGVATEVLVRGITGRDVTQLLVSRDGSRLVAVVRHRSGDDVVACRVRQEEDGTLVRVLHARRVALPDDRSSRIRDLAWRSPTTVSTLSANTGDLSEVRTVSVDGAPGEIATEGSTRPRGRTSSLVSSPVATAGVYAVSGRTLTDLTNPEVTLAQLPAGLRQLTYAG